MHTQNLIELENTFLFIDTHEQIDTEHGADSPANIPEIIEQIEHTARHKHGSNSGQERGELVMIFCAFDEIFRNEMVEKKNLIQEICDSIL